MITGSYCLRAPWTLADDRVWRRTHRAARLPLAGFGLAIALVSVFARDLGIWVIVAGAGALFVWSMAYSHLVARSLG